MCDSSNSSKDIRFIIILIYILLRLGLGYHLEDNVKVKINGTIRMAYHPYPNAFSHLNQDPDGFIYKSLSKCVYTPNQFSSFNCPPDRCIGTIYWIDFSQDRLCYGESTCIAKTTFTEHCSINPSCNSIYSCVGDLPNVHFNDDFSCTNMSEYGLQYSKHDYPNACQIGSHKIRDCKESFEDYRKVYWFKMNNNLYFSDKLTVVHNEGPTYIANYNCSGECPSKGCDETTKCAGDAYYCYNFPCDENSKCRCSRTKNSGWLEIKTRSGHTIRPSCVGSSIILVKLEKHSSSYDNMSPECKDCKVECDSNGITLHTRLPNGYKFRLCKNPTCITGEATMSPYNIKPDGNFFKTSGLIRAQIWVDGFTDPIHLEGQCPQLTSCDLIDCDWCVTRYQNISCYKWFHWLIVVIIISITSLGISAVLSNLDKFLKLINYLIFIILLIMKAMTSILLWISKIIKKMYVRIKMLGDDEVTIKNMEEANQYKDVSSVSIDMPNFSYQRRPVNTRALLYTSIVLGTHISNSLQCSVFTTFTTPSEFCSFKSGGVETCTVINIARLSMAPIGQTSCYSISDPLHKFLGSLSLTTNSIHLQCKERSLYYVPEATSSCASFKNCRNVGDCSDSKCEDWPSDKPIPSQPTDASGLGWSGCNRVCGCAGCGCFLCSDACLFWRKYLINPSKMAYEIVKCDSWNFAVNITVNINSTDKNTHKNILLRPGFPIGFEDLDLTLISISLPPQPILNKCFMKFGKKIAMTSCNDRDQTLAGQIGEIQCNTLDQARNLYNCKTASNLIDLTAHEDSVSCSSSLVSPEKIFQDHSLPVHTNGLFITNDNNNIQADISATALLEYQITSNNLKLRAQTNRNSCFVQFKNISGCYSCLIGAQLAISVYTDFGDAIGLLECFDINLHSPINVKESERSITILFMYNKANIDTECILACPASSTKFKIRGTLAYINLQDYRNNTKKIGVQVNPPTSGFHWTSIFDMNLFGTWWKKLLAIILCVIILFVSFFLIMLCKKCFSKTHYKVY